MGFSATPSDRNRPERSPLWAIEVQADEPLESRYLAVLSQGLAQGHTPHAIRDRSQRRPPSNTLASRLAKSVLKLESAMARCEPMKPPPVPHDIPDERRSDVLVLLQPESAGIRARPPGPDTVIVITWPAGASTSTVGLREVIDRQPTVRFRVATWTAGAAAPMDVDVSVPTQFPFSWTRDLVLRKAMTFAAQCALRLLQSGRLPLGSLEHGAQARPCGLPAVAMPPTQAWRVLEYGARMAARMVHKLFLRAVSQSNEWHVRLSPRAWRDHVRHEGPLLANPPGCYWADPFVIEHEGRTVVFVEEYVHARGLAHLSALEVDEAGRVTPLGACLTEDFHLSFPYVFRWKGELYMLPETHQAQQIRVYRCLEFPLKWELAAVLKDQVSAADSVVFEKDGRWWLLTNIDSSGGGDHCSELHVFWSDHPLSTQWTPHPANPVVCDAARARNGGFILEDGRVLRVSQMQAYGVYGSGYSVSEITTLSETDYREKTVCTKHPDGRTSTGAHHLSSTGRWSASDELRAPRLKWLGA